MYEVAKVMSVYASRLKVLPPGLMSRAVMPELFVYLLAYALLQMHVGGIPVKGMCFWVAECHTWLVN